jgi:5-methylcytosine-specific restriction enzyme subunit McrC
MTRLTLFEYEWSGPVELATGERDGILALYPSMQIRPVAGSADHYSLQPQSLIGAVKVGDVDLEIRPKRPVNLRRALFLVSYALDGVTWHDMQVELATQSLVEAIVPVFASAVQRAFVRGLLQGYRTEEDALLTVRGRIRFDDQIRSRFGRFPPVEVRFDEYTEDILENRLILAAIDRLRRLRLRADRSSHALGAFEPLLEHVTLFEYTRRHVPVPAITRLNNHYAPALGLARLILDATAFDLGSGATVASAFLVDMNRVFEEFVRSALRESLKLTDREFPGGNAVAPLYLDKDRRIRLRPDLSWWGARGIQFIGDVKYKRTTASGVLHPDLYQLLAYAVASDLPGGLLVYAAGEPEGRHQVVHAGKELQVTALDLSGEPSDILASVDRIAEDVRSLAARGRTAARRLVVA